MGYALWGMAVRAEQAAVMEALPRWPSEREGRLEPVTRNATAEAGWVDFVMAPHEGWTVCRFPPGLIPALVLHLSRALNTRVVSVSPPTPMSPTSTGFTDDH